MSKYSVQSTRESAQKFGLTESSVVTCFLYFYIQLNSSRFCDAFEDRSRVTCARGSKRPRRQAHLPVYTRACTFTDTRPFSFHALSLPILPPSLLPVHRLVTCHGTVILPVTRKKFIQRQRKWLCHQCVHLYTHNANVLPKQTYTRAGRKHKPPCTRVSRISETRPT